MSSLLRVTPLIGVVLWECSDDTGITQPPDEGPAAVPAAIARVSGDAQELTSGELLEPLVVRVTDARGVGVRRTPVAWSVLTGDGDFASPDGWSPRTVTMTSTDGRAEVFFRLKAVGTTTVMASVEGLEIPPVTFTASSTFLQVIAGYWYGREFVPSDVTISVGTPLEWLNVYYYSEPHTVTSLSVPPGGTAFDSGPLKPGDRFRFVPEVAGTWQYFCEIHGAEEESGTITVQQER